MSTEEFDDIVRKKLEQPLQADDPRAWDLFMLSAMERGEETLFEDTSADEIVKSTLGDFKAEYNQDSWDSLAKKLDLAEQDAEPHVVQAKFDKVVSNSLKGITRKYDAATWPKLAARIEAEEKYLKHYYRAKAIEALLFCFLVLTLFEWVQSGKLNKPVLDQKTTETVLNQPVTAGNPDLPAKPFETASSIHSINNTGLDSKPLKAGIQPVGSGLAINTPGNLPLGITDQIIDAQTGPRENFTLASLQKPTTAQADVLYNSRSGIDHKIPAYILPAASQVVEQIHHELNEVPVTQTLNLAKTLTKSLLGTWKFGMFTHSDYNQIYLPDQYLLVYGVKSPLYSAKTVKSIGYGAGFKAHYIKKRLGAEIGLGYSKRSYAPNRKYYLDPFWNISFKKIEYDIVEMPISLKYTSKGNTRLKTYAMVGVNANFIAKAIYDVLPEIKQVRTTNDLQLTVEQNFIKSRVEDQFTILDKRRALLYGQGSLGMEWKVNPKMDIYSQLTYGQRVLTKQFGPNWDQFRSLSLEMGVKTSIN